MRRPASMTMPRFSEGRAVDHGLYVDSTDAPGVFWVVGRGDPACASFKLSLEVNPGRKIKGCSCGHKPHTPNSQPSQRGAGAPFHRAAAVLVLAETAGRAFAVRG